MFIQSLGDVVVLVHLATFVVQTLNDAATKAPKQVKDLIDDASRLKRMLTNMETIIDRQGAALKPHDEIKQDMVQILIRCGEMVEGLKHIATSYKSIAAKEGEGAGSESRAKQWLKAMNSLQGLYRRVKWTTVDAAVKDLRGLLQQHMQALQVIMQFLATQQMTELQLGVSRILQLMENHPGKVDQNFRSISYATPSRSPTSPAIDSETQSPTTGTPFLSPLIPSQSTSLSGFSPDFRKSPATSPPFEVADEQLALQPLEPLKLPDAIIDPFSFVFPHDLPLNLDNNFPTSALEEDFQYAGPVSEVEQDEFVDNLIAKKEHVRIPVDSVNFVFQKSEASEKAVINASDVGELLMLKTGSGGNTAVTDIWTLNAARTVRIRQKVPIWDVIIPYSPHGDKKSAVISQGFGLSFVILEKGHQETHSIPTTWVTYNFSAIDDCNTFQNLLYGWDLLHTIPVKEIYIAHTFSSDELLAARENIRIWKDPNGPEIQFMVHLQMKEGRKKYLKFDLGQESIKPVFHRDLTLHLEGINALVYNPLYMNERKRSTTSSSSTSTTSSRRSVFRRFSPDRSPYLDKITVGFSDHKARDELLKVALNSRRATN